MTGEVGKEKDMCTSLKHKDTTVLQHLYCQRDVHLVLEKKGGGRKRREERHSHLLSTMRTTSYQPFI